MEYINEYLEERLKIKPLGKIKLEDDVDFSSNLSGAYLVIDDYNTGIFISHADYYTWLETKYKNQKDNACKWLYKNITRIKDVYLDKDISERDKEDIINDFKETINK